MEEKVDFKRIRKLMEDIVVYERFQLLNRRELVERLSSLSEERKIAFLHMIGKHICAFTIVGELVKETKKEKIRFLLALEAGLDVRQLMDSDVACASFSNNLRRVKYDRKIRPILQKWKDEFQGEIVHLPEREIDQEEFIDLLDDIRRYSDLALRVRPREELFSALRSLTKPEREFFLKFYMAGIFSSQEKKWTKVLNFILDSGMDVSYLMGEELYDPTIEAIILGYRSKRQTVSDLVNRHLSRGDYVETGLGDLVAKYMFRGARSPGKTRIRRGSKSPRKSSTRRGSKSPRKNTKRKVSRKRSRK